MLQYKNVIFLRTYGENIKNLCQGLLLLIEAMNFLFQKGY